MIVTLPATATVFPAWFLLVRRRTIFRAVALGLLLTGCRSAPMPVEETTPVAAVRHEGQAAWTPAQGQAAVVIDLQLWTRSTGEASLDVSKAGLPFVAVHLTRRGWRIEAVTGARYSARGEPPARVGWLQLATALAGRRPTPPWRMEQKVDGNWRLSNAGSGESFDGFLTP